MYGVVDNVCRVDGVLEVGGHLLHGHPCGTLVQKHVRLVGKGEEKKDGRKEHLYGDHEVVVSC